MIWKPHSPEIQLMLALARYLSEGDAADEIEPLLQQPLDWRRFEECCVRHELYPLVHRTLERLQLPSVPSELTSRLGSAAAENEIKALQLYAGLLRISRVFAEAGVRALPLKGPALALQIFGDIGLRRSLDLDFFVSLDDLPKAGDALLQEGYARAAEEEGLTPRQRRHLVRSTSHSVFRHASRKYWLDLHWKLDHHDRFRLDFVSAWERAVPLEADQDTLMMLSPEDTIHYLAFHGTKHKWFQLKWLVDLDACMRQDPGPRTEALVARAEELKTEDVLGQALIILRKHLQTPVPEALQERFARRPKAKRLAEAVGAFMFRENIQGVGRFRKLRDLSWHVRLYGLRRFLVGQYLLPDSRLYRRIPLPDSLHGLYYVINPFFRLWILLRCAFRRGG